MRNSNANKYTRQANNMGRKRRYGDFIDDHEVSAEKEPANSVIQQSAKRRKIDLNGSLKNPSHKSQIS